MTVARRFTPAEDQLIVDAYPTTMLKDIAARLGRCWTVVQVRVQRLAREGRLDPRQRCHNPPWTAADDDYLVGGIGQEASMCYHINQQGRDRCKLRLLATSSRT